MRGLKLFLIALILSVFSSVVFADDYFISLGGADLKEDAETIKESLLKNGISSDVRKFSKVSGGDFYRVFFAENFATQDEALSRRKLLLSEMVDKGLPVENVWIVSVSTKKYIEPEPEPERTIVVKDSDTGEPIPQVTCIIGDKWNLKTSPSGSVVLPEDVVDGEYELKLSKESEYVPTKTSFVVKKNSIVGASQFSIPRAVEYNRVKVVLDWGKAPADLDAHCYSESNHVYFEKRESGNLNLDRDDTMSYGPETITIKDPSPSETYQIYVFNYTDRLRKRSNRLSLSGAQITVYLDNDCVGTYKIKENQVGLWWHVLDIKNKNEIVLVDEVSNVK